MKAGKLKFQIGDLVVIGTGYPVRRLESSLAGKSGMILGLAKHNFEKARPAYCVLIGDETIPLYLRNRNERFDMKTGNYLITDFPLSL